MPVYEENFKVNGQKVYFIRCYVDGPNGRKQIKRHNKRDWIGINGKRLAQQEEIRLMNKKYNNYKDMTVNQLTQNYLDYISKSLKLSTFRNVSDIIRLYILPFFKNKKIQSLTTNAINDWHNYLLQKKFSIRFNQDIHTSFSTILNHGCKFYNLEKNVARLAGNFKNLSTKKKEMNYLTVEEFNRFISYEENELYKNFFYTLFYTGMRKGEVWCLTKDDIDFDNKKISIRKAYNPRNKGITSPKTQKSNRDIIMVDELYNRLINIIPDEDGYIFGLKRISATTLARKCKQNCIKAGINKNIRIHDFRHSFASLCINNNIPIRLISNYMGHENISTTLDIYGHLYPDTQHELIDCLNTFLLKQVQKQVQEKEKPLFYKGLKAFGDPYEI